MNILLYESQRGEKSVEVFLQTLDLATTAKVIRTIDLLEQYGPTLGMPYSKKVKGSIYELRIRGKVEIRIFYTFYNEAAFLLHAFQKKTQKIPARELYIVMERYKEIRMQFD